MNILILGGVAAGTKTAAKLKREDRSLNVTILTKDQGHFLRWMRLTLLCGRPH